jgi:chitodextrinase
VNKLMAGWLVVALVAGCDALGMVDGDSALENGGTAGDGLTQNLTVVDAYVRSGANYAGTNFGKAAKVIVDAPTSSSDSTFRGYVKIGIPAFSGAATAKLRLYVLDAASVGPEIRLTSNFNEGGLTWNNQPGTSGTLVKTLGSVSTGWLEINLTNFVRPGEVLALVFVPRSADRFAFASREGTSNKPEFVLVTDTTPPSTPGNLNASAVSTSQINLSWSASSDDTAVTGYKIFRATEAGALTYLTTVAASTTSFQSTGLSAATSYTYKVQAFDASNNVSALSSSATARTQSPADATAPSTPTGLVAAAASSTRIDLTWTASTDNVGVSDYKIFRGTAGAAPTYLTTVAGTTTSFSNTGLTASTSYTYKVQALDAAGNASALSSAATTSTDGEYTVFNPKNYGGYDPTGATESTASFQTAIDRAAAHAVLAGATGLYHAELTPMVNEQGVNVGPNKPQAVVRVERGVFMIDDVFLKPNVRLEIHAGAMLIHVKSLNAVLLYMAQASGTSLTYLTNVTVTSYGSSDTFMDTGRRCTAAHLASPCELPKKVKYADMTFRDGSSWTTENTALAKRFTIDRDVRRYPDADKDSGDTPRGSGIRLRQVKNFLVENMVELAHPGDLLYPDSTPTPGPTAYGSNTYSATAGNGVALGAVTTPDGGTDDFRTEAVQPRNGTLQKLHCEDCTRGYGIIEIHAGVDLEYRYISTRGGIAIRWESGGNGRSTRQTAKQVVAYDCNTAVLMSTHENNQNGLGVPGPEQDTLRASAVKAISCENGFRSATTGGTNVNSSVSDFYIYAGGIEGHPGGRAQVVICRGGGGSGSATPDGCKEYGVDYFDDDAWRYLDAKKAIDNTISIPYSKMYCVESDFVEDNSNANCTAFQ